MPRPLGQPRRVPWGYCLSSLITPQDLDQLGKSEKLTQDAVNVVFAAARSLLSNHIHILTVLPPREFS